MLLVSGYTYIVRINIRNFRSGQIIDTDFIVHSRFIAFDLQINGIYKILITLNIVQRLIHRLRRVL